MEQPFWEQRKIIPPLFTLVVAVALILLGVVWVDQREGFEPQEIMTETTFTKTFKCGNEEDARLTAKKFFEERGKGRKSVGKARSEIDSKGCTKSVTIFHEPMTDYRVIRATKMSFSENQKSGAKKCFQVINPTDKGELDRVIRRIMSDYYPKSDLAEYTKEAIGVSYIKVCLFIRPKQTAIARASSPPCSDGLFLFPKDIDMM